jgi:mannose-6-phosphate isomerase-like protein (cupin superfamily)
MASPAPKAAVAPSGAAGRNYLITQLDALPAVPCPCGTSRRGFATEANQIGTIHLVDIRIDARTHYHKRLTETYLILEGEGVIELDGERVPVKPMTSILIQPGCRHRLVGKFKIVNYCVPPFDPADEWFD